MAETMQFDLVSPERRLASMQASEVRIPGADGDLTAMASHSPTITTLRPGILTVVGPEGETQFAVTGGFAEIGEGVTVLAERAMPRDEMTQEVFDSYVEEARTAHETARATNEPGPVDDAAKLLADMVAMGTHIGLDPKQSNL
jgi:F-type H+-transporting ATPase subunit epsilon